MSVETVTLGTTTYLAGEEDVVESFRLDGEPVADVADGLRAATATPRNRLSRRRSFSFLVKRAPAASPADCRLAIIQHEIELSQAEQDGEKDVVWSYRGIGYVLRDVVVKHSSEQRGVTSYHTYTGTFGALETSSL